MTALSSSHAGAEPRVAASAKKKWDPLGPSYFANMDTPYIKRLLKRDLFYKPENESETAVHQPDEFSKPVLAEHRNNTVMSHLSQNRSLQNFEHFFSLGYSHLESFYLSLTESFLFGLAAQARSSQGRLRKKVREVRSKIITH